MGKARKFRQSIHSCEHVKQFAFTCDDYDFYEYLKSYYEQIKSGKSTRELEMVADTDLFLVSVGLFAFGQLDVAEDILDNIPNRSCPASHLAGVLNQLLPLPNRLNCYKNPHELRQWLRIKSIYLKWSEREERYILENFKVLSSLSSNCDLKAFSYSHNLSDSQGLIVEFFKDDGTSWKSQFQSGTSGISEVVQHPNRNDLIVISQGKVYIVDLENEQLLELFGGNVGKLIEVIDLRSILFVEGSSLFCYDSSGFLWRNAEIDWRKIRDIKVKSGLLEGQFLSSQEDTWLPFWLEMKNGKFNVGKFKIEDLLQKKTEKVLVVVLKKIFLWRFSCA